jgi:preprotein translocase subunit YajC
MKKILSLGLILVLLTATLLFTGGCAEGEGMESLGLWPMLGLVAVMFTIMYFIMIRPQQKRQKEHEQLMDELKKGDRVVTIGGIYGRIESISEDSVILKVESGATIRVARSSVANTRDK